MPIAFSEFVPWLSPCLTCSGRHNTIPCDTDLGNTKISLDEVSIVMVGIGWPSVALADALLWIVTERQTALKPDLCRPSVVGSLVK